MNSGMGLENPANLEPATGRSSGETAWDAVLTDGDGIGKYADENKRGK